MNGKYPRYTLHLDDKHPSQPVFIRDDSASGQPDQSGLHIATDLLLTLALAGLTYIALSSYPELWPGWLQTVTGAGFAIAAGYLAIRYYTLLMALYLLSLCGAAAVSAVAFLWWIF